MYKDAINCAIKCKKGNILKKTFEERRKNGYAVVVPFGLENRYEIESDGKRKVKRKIEEEKPKNRKEERKTARRNMKEQEMKIEKPVPVKGTYDVIVAGGGTAGAFAAMAAAREGAKVLLLEQFTCLGGSATLGLVGPLMTSRMANFDGHCDLGRELNRRMAEVGGVNETGMFFDGELLKIVLEQMVAESGCRIQYETTLVDAFCCEKTSGWETEASTGTEMKCGREPEIVSGREPEAASGLEKKLCRVLVAGKDGLAFYEGSFFIDATGDGDLANFAGVPFHSGDGEGKNQPTSLRFEMAGVDYGKLGEFLKENGETNLRYFDMNTPCVKKLLWEAVEKGNLTEQDCTYVQAFGRIPGREDAMSMNFPEMAAQKETWKGDVRGELYRQGREAILRFYRFLRETIPGFEKAYLTGIAPLLGVRESRRIESKGDLCVEDLLSYRKFADAVTASAYPLDVHGLAEEKTYDRTVPQEERYWEVPFSCMEPREMENLLVVGRCAGMDFYAQSAARVQLICRAMGEAAGKEAARRALLNVK